MRSQRLYTAALLFLGACGGARHVAQPAAQGADTLSLERREAIVARARAVITESFAHWEGVPNLDFDSLHAAYRRQALASSSRRDFDRASSAFFGALRNGHTRFEDQWLTDATPRMGFAVLTMGGEWIVTRSEHAALMPGDTIRAVDGQPVDRLFAARRDELFASDDEAARMFFFTGRLHPLRMRLTLANGRDVEIDRTTLAPPPAAVPAETRGRWLVADSVAYIAIPSFNGGRFQERALELLREYAHAPALVVDVRGNGGGNTPRPLIRALLDRPAQWWTEASALRRDVARGPASRGQPGQPVRNAGGDRIEPEAMYRGRLIVLADRWCASACEDFLMPLRVSGRAIVVGERTMGTTGQPRFEDLGDGMRIVVGAKRAYFPDGSTFEGVGIAPTIAAPPTAADVRARRDGMLAAALEAARGVGSR